MVEARVCSQVHQTVGQAEALLREHHIHAVPGPLPLCLSMSISHACAVWHPAAKKWEVRSELRVVHGLS